MKVTPVIIFLVISVSRISGDLLIGGLSEEQKPIEKDDQILAIVPMIADDIRSEVEAELVSGGTLNAHNDVTDAPITVLAYKTQVVAGINYFVKAKIGKFIFHLRIYEDLKGQPSLSSVKGPMKESDPIEYFY